MPPPSEPLEKLGFLTIGSFDGADPGPGHETTLQVIELGEQLGFDSAWVRHRHLQYGISSPVAVLAAATQRTRRIALGTAVIPLGWENPLRLAEDLATVDILSGGRLNPGVSVGPPMRYDDVRDALYPDTADIEDFSYERVLRLLRFVAGEQASPFRGRVGIEDFSDRVEPHSPGLRDRMWYGGASLRSAQWAGARRAELPVEQRRAGRGVGGLRRDPALATGDLPGAPPRGRGGPRVAGARRDPDRRRDSRAAGEVRGVRRGPHPADGDAAGACADDVRPGHHGHGRPDRRDALRGPGFRLVREVVFALPFSFAADDYVQILTDIATKLGPALGWRPTG